MERTVVTPLFARSAEEMRPALLEILRVPAGLPHIDISTADDPGAAILTLDNLLLGSS
jgi:hypothetical protein